MIADRVEGVPAFNPFQTVAVLQDEPLTHLFNLDAYLYLEQFRNKTLSMTTLFQNHPQGIIKRKLRN